VPTFLKSTRAAQQNVGGLAVRMHQSEFVHVSQSREHTSQDVPHPCNFQRHYFQEPSDVRVEALKDEANHRISHTMPQERLKESDVQKFDDVGVGRQSDVAPHFVIGSTNRRKLATPMKDFDRHHLMCDTARNS
jgi:hypothetical protein